MFSETGNQAVKVKANTFEKKFLLKHEKPRCI